MIGSPIAPPFQIFLEPEAGTSGVQHEPSTLTEDLIQRSIGGDEHAFEDLIRTYKNQVVRTAARFARTPPDLDEIAQEVFIQLFRSLRKFDRRCSFETWVTRITIRRCYDYLRALYRRRWFSSLDALRESGFDPAAESGEPADPRVENLRAAMRKLKPDQQMILTLLELEGYSVREVSALTKWSEGNVKVRALRARATLRAEYEKQGISNER